MTALEATGWPAPDLVTERLLLRPTSAADRPAFLELFSSALVDRYLNSARPRDELDTVMPEVPGERPGVFAVHLDGETVGAVMIDRCDEGTFGRQTGEADLGYLFLPRAWGHGYATEACTAVLDWFAATFPGQSVQLTAREANVPSRRVAEKLGFVEVTRFEQYGAAQWLGRWTPDTTPA